MNLDPFKEHTGEELLGVLGQVGLLSWVESRGGVDSAVEGGGNLSVG